MAFDCLVHAVFKCLGVIYVILIVLVGMGIAVGKVKQLETLSDFNIALPQSVVLCVNCKGEGSPSTVLKFSIKKNCLKCIK